MKNLQKLIDSLYVKVAIETMAEEMNKNKESDSFKSSAGELVLDDDEEVQVQVIITRNKKEFMDPFEIIQYN